MAGRNQLADALSTISANTETAEAYTALRAAAPARQDTLWYVINPPEGEVAAAPGVISLWVSNMIGPIDKTPGLARID